MKGHMTLPAEIGQEEVVKKLYRYWKADALRDSDGTAMPQGLKNIGSDIYSTICLVRSDQDFADQHPEFLHRKFLMSSPKIAFGEELKIALLDGYSRAKYVVDSDGDPKNCFEVIDRSSGNTLSSDTWDISDDYETVTIHKAAPYHLYTVNFLVKQVWDSVSMYNHLTNGWSGRKIKSLDPYHPECRAHLLEWFKQWLEDHPDTTVVRFTTFAFNFVIDSGEENQDIYRDWLGYGETVSHKALSDFRAEYGFEMTAEDFVDKGYYNTTNRNPSKAYLCWMEFIQKFVSGFSKELVDLAHAHGKKAAMFQGDHWIGTEPFSKRYRDIGIDINIGAVEDGVALRRLSDSPGDMIKEARFYPYFFPDVFREGADPIQGSMASWLKIRRALLRAPIDRIGYGGYLSLVEQFPDFVDHVAAISNEFGAFIEKSAGSSPYTHGKRVVILSSWGKIRSWLQNPVKDQRFFVPERPDIMDFVGSNPMECLAGLPFDVDFMSFEDIKRDGIGADVGTIINMGDAGTAWTGDGNWGDPNIVIAIREFVAQGGSFLGIGEPSSFLQNGSFFQLHDLLGIEKETGLSMGRVCQPLTISGDHVLRRYLTGSENFGNVQYVYPSCNDLKIVAKQGQHILCCTHDYGSGRSVYISNLPYSPENSRFLQHVILWLQGINPEDLPFVSKNPYVDVAYYPESSWLAAVNASGDEQAVEFVTDQGEHFRQQLQAYSWVWKKI